MAKSAKPAVAKHVKNTAEATTSKKAEKSAEFLQDSDDSEDIDMVNTAPRMGESESDDDSDDDSSDEDSDEKEDVAGPPKAQKKKDGSYA